MKIINAETGLREDGCFVATERESQLATESLATQERIRVLEAQLRVANHAKDSAAAGLRDVIASEYRKLTEVQAAQKTEREKVNRLRGFV